MKKKTILIAIILCSFSALPLFARGGRGGGGFHGGGFHGGGFHGGGFHGGGFHSGGGRGGFHSSGRHAGFHDGGEHGGKFHGARPKHERVASHAGVVRSHSPIAPHKTKSLQKGKNINNKMKNAGQKIKQHQRPHPMHNHPMYKHGGYWYGDRYHRGVVMDPYGAYYDSGLCVTWPWFCGIGAATTLGYAVNNNGNGY